MATISNLFIDQGTTFTTTISVADGNGTALDLTGYSGIAQLRKTYESITSVGFNVSFETPRTNGQVTISLTDAQTSALESGVLSLDYENTSANQVEVRSRIVGFGTTATGIGTYHFNEIVQGMRSGTQARVKNWDFDTGILKVGNVGIGTTTTGFFPGEDIKGLSSGALFSVLHLMMKIVTINIMKVIYLSQKQTYSSTLQNQIPLVVSNVR